VDKTRAVCVLNSNDKLSTIAIDISTGTLGKTRILSETASRYAVSESTLFWTDSTTLQALDLTVDDAAPVKVCLKRLILTITPDISAGWNMVDCDA
jgi:hypothetical protein